MPNAKLPNDSVSKIMKNIRNGAIKHNRRTLNATNYVTDNSVRSPKPLWINVPRVIIVIMFLGFHQKSASFTLPLSSSHIQRHTQSDTWTKDLPSSFTHWKSPRPSNLASSVTETTTVVDASEIPVDLKYTEFSLEHGGGGDGDDVVGPEGHEPVILLHGLLGQKRNFATFGSSLAAQLEKKRRILALDLRNHGDNGHDWRDEMSHSHMARDVLALMDTLNIPKAIVIGHSMGGKIAMNLALTHPHRISGLVVLDTSPVAYDSSNNPAWKTVENIVSVVRGVKLEPGRTKRDIDVDLRQSIEDPALRAFVLTNLEKASCRNGGDGEMLRWKINIESIASELDQIADFVLSQDVTSRKDLEETPDQPSRQRCYEGDTFFINGGASNFVRSAHMPVIAEYFPNYMLTTIRGVGHWVHAEAPGDTLALLKRYLDR